MNGGNSSGENSIKGWFDIPPHYIGFFLAFLKNPSTALLTVKGTSKISSDLVAILIGGVALSYLIVLGSQSPGLAAASDGVFGWLGRIDRNSMPFVVLILIVLVAVIVHIVAKIVAKVLRDPAPGLNSLPGPDLGGTVEDSVNAALGFAAVFVPIAAGVFSLTAWSASVWVGAVAGIGLLGLVLVYLPRALSATHPNTTVVQAFLAVSVAVTAVTVALSHVD